MSKTIRNVFDKYLTFDYLMIAYERAKKNKKKNRELLLFEMNLETNIYNLYRELKSGKYKRGKYREFTIYEPKERIIRSLPFKDRIVDIWYVENFIKPYFKPRFISDTYACLPCKGTHKALNKLKKFSDKMYLKYENFYYVKCDIKKFFYSIDKDILQIIMSKYISDKKLLKFTEIMIDDGRDKGIPIGNYSSQYFANIYLNELDKYLKFDLKIKFYLRYMDDFCCLVKTKKEAICILNAIRNFTGEKLNLDLNHKSVIIPSYLGIDFVGFKIIRNKIYVRKSFLLRIKKRFRKWNKLFKENRLSKKKMTTSITSFNSHIKHSNSANITFFYLHY